jgi:hypothetical protein
VAHRQGEYIVLPIGEREQHLEPKATAHNDDAAPKGEELIPAIGRDIVNTQQGIKLDCGLSHSFIPHFRLRAWVDKIVANPV